MVCVGEAYNKIISISKESVPKELYDETVEKVQYLEKLVPKALQDSYDRIVEENTKLRDENRNLIADNARLDEKVKNNIETIKFKDEIIKGLKESKETDIKKARESERRIAELEFNGKKKQAVDNAKKNTAWKVRQIEVSPVVKENEMFREILGLSRDTNIDVKDIKNNTDNIKNNTDDIKNNIEEILNRTVKYDDYFENILSILNSDKSDKEKVEHVKKEVEHAKDYSSHRLTREEKLIVCEKIRDLKVNTIGITNKEIGDILYNEKFIGFDKLKNVKSAENKVCDYINSKLYKELCGEA